MAVTTIRVPHSRASDYKGAASMSARTILRHVTNLLQGVGQGAYPGGTALEVAQTCASGTVTFGEVSGTGGCVVNGVTLTADLSNLEGVEASVVIADLVNASANPLVSNHVTASVADEVVTLTAKHPGHPGNAITLAASGTGVTASGARLTNGTSTTYSF